MVQAEGFTPNPGQFWVEINNHYDLPQFHHLRALPLAPAGVILRRIWVEGTAVAVTLFNRLQASTASALRTLKAPDPNTNMRP